MAASARVADVWLDCAASDACNSCKLISNARRCSSVRGLAACAQPQACQWLAATTTAIRRILHAIVANPVQHSARAFESAHLVEPTSRGVSITPLRSRFRWYGGPHSAAPEWESLKRC